MFSRKFLRLFYKFQVPGTGIPLLGLALGGAVLFAALSPALAFAQDQQSAPAAQKPATPSGSTEKEDNSLRINIGIGAGKPGDPLDIPVTFSAPEDAQMESAVIHVSFPPASLNYTGVERGLAVELGNGQVTATSAPDKSDPSLTVLEVNITGKTAIKPGILAYLKFEVAQSAKKGDVPLKLMDYKALSAQNTPVQLAKGDDGLITVFSPDETIPVIGCFFFTH